MKKSHVLQGIRKMRFEEIYSQRTERRLSVEQAAELLGVSERTFRRWVDRYETQGAEGLADKRLEKAAHNAAPADEVAELLSLFETHYQGWTAAHFYERYKEKHQGARCYTWVKRRLQEAGGVTKAKKRGSHRRKRPRKPMAGMMLHQDGSTHQWIDGEYWDLIVTLDDATNEIYSAFFTDQEGTWSSFKGVEEVISKRGLFCSLYVDRGSHYFITPKAGGKIDKSRQTQFARALSQLGIDLIAAYSPQARGRSERMFRTLQGRLPQELSLAGIQAIEEANRYLDEVFISSFNRRFKVAAESEETAFVPYLGAPESLREILCKQDLRTVNKDNTVNYCGRVLQLETRRGCCYARTQVRVHGYPDGSASVFHGPRCIGRFPPSSGTRDGLAVSA